METATVTVEGDRQTVRLPKSVHLPPTVFVRQDGDAVVLEPAKPKTWPEGFQAAITHLLDTDTCIGVLRQRPGMVQRLSQLAPTDCAISMVTVFELFCGLAKAQDPAKERQKVDRFVSAIIELPFDRPSAEAAANIRAELERQGTPIGSYDLLIAGRAVASGLTLVTNNVGEIQRVSGLKLESWP